AERRRHSTDVGGGAPCIRRMGGEELRVSGRSRASGNPRRRVPGERSETRDPEPQPPEARPRWSLSSRKRGRGTSGGGMQLSRLKPRWNRCGKIAQHDEAVIFRSRSCYLTKL